jgi:hypothetical protein
MQDDRPEPDSRLRGVDAAMEALTARAPLESPFAPGPALMIDAGENTPVPWFDDADAWLTTGANAALRLLDGVIDPDEPLTLIGGDAEAVAELQRRYGLKDIRWRRTPARLKHNPDAILAAAEFAAAQESRFVFICVEASAQAALARAIVQRSKGRGVGLCVALSLDDVCGRADRIPQWLGLLRLGWLHRLLRERGS